MDIDCLTTLQTRIPAKVTRHANPFGQRRGPEPNDSRAHHRAEVSYFIVDFLRPRDCFADLSA